MIKDLIDYEECVELFFFQRVHVKKQIEDIEIGTYFESAHFDSVEGILTLNNELEERRFKLKLVVGHEL